MNSLLVLGLHCCTVLLVCAAPTPDHFIGPLSDDAEFHRTAERARVLVEKIVREVPAVHQASVRAEGLTLDPADPPGSLQLMALSLGIPPAPALRALSAHFTLETCLRRMSLGLQLHLELLGALEGRLAAPVRVTELRADLRELLARVNKMQELAALSVTTPSEEGGSGLASRLAGDYQVQVATHLTLLQLRTFSQDLRRGLRNIHSARTQG